MHTFQFTRLRDVAEAIAATATARTTQAGTEMRFIAGGTTLIDLMKLNVEQPDTLVDINHLALAQVESLPVGRAKRSAHSSGTPISHIIPWFSVIIQSCRRPCFPVHLLN